MISVGWTELHLTCCKYWPITNSRPFSHIMRNLQSSQLKYMIFRSLTCILHVKTERHLQLLCCYIDLIMSWPRPGHLNNSFRYWDWRIDNVKCALVQFSVQISVSPAHKSCPGSESSFYNDPRRSQLEPKTAKQAEVPGDLPHVSAVHAAVVEMVSLTLVKLLAISQLQAWTKCVRKSGWMWACERSQLPVSHAWYLTGLLSVFGLPHQLVSNNSPRFISGEFAKKKKKGVKCVCSAPFHPSTNGLAERFVQ